MENLKLAMKGDENSYNQLMILHYNKFFSYCLKICKNYHQAEEIIQDVFIKCKTKIKELRSIDSFFSWMNRIIYHEIVTKKRISRKYCTLNSDIEWTNHDDEIDIKFLISKLEKESDRNIITLYYFDDKSIKDISVLLQCPTGTIKRRLFCARQKLKSLIERI